MPQPPAAPLSPSAEQLVAALTGGPGERGLHQLLVALLEGHAEAAASARVGVDAAALSVAARRRLEQGDPGDLWSARKLAGRAQVRAEGQGRPVIGPADVAAVLLEAGRGLLAGPRGKRAEPNRREPGAVAPWTRPAAPEPPEGVKAGPRPEPALPGATPPGSRPPFPTAPAPLDPPTAPASAGGPTDTRRAAAQEGAGPVPGAEPGALVRTFRVFVSSTFDDMGAERDALARLAWPRLREFCAEKGARFQAIDLRWGVSEEAALDQQTMNLCLDEVRRCHQVTPRPNFLVLAGNHYGWRPLPPQVPANEYEMLRDLVLEGPPPRPDAARGLDDWYVEDRNAVPREYRLKPRTGEFVEYERWEQEERRLRGILDGAVAALAKHPELPPLAATRLVVYRASATEQEIRAGALGAEVDEGSAFWVQRDLTGEPTPDQADTFGRKFRDPDQAPVGELRKLLQERVGDPVGVYQARWEPDRGPEGGPSIDHVSQLAEEVAAALERSIERELKPSGKRPAVIPVDRSVPGDDLLDEEGEEHRRFVEERVQVFVGRQDQLAEVDRYLRGGSPRPLVVCGGGGTGKSAFLAEVVCRARTTDPDAPFVYRFIGATPGSSDGRSLLDGVCRELARRSGQGDAAVPSDYQELVKDFAQRLGAGTSQRPVVVVLDSLDQLSASDGAHGLSWIPSPLPDHARLVVSTRDLDAEGHPLETFQALRERAEVLVLPPLSREDGKRLLQEWLKRAGRTLQAAQREAVLDAFTASEGRPLYLEMAFEEARRWPSGDGKPPRPLAAGIEPLIRENLFARLAAKDRHGEMLVSRALGYVAASRYGLAEDELLDLLARDLDVYRWFLKGGKHLPPDLIGAAVAYRAELPATAAAGKEVPAAERAAFTWLEETRSGGGEDLDRFLEAVLTRPDGPRLPVVLWSRLGFDLRPYLTERRSEAGPLLGFYHRELHDAASSAYAAAEDAALLHGRMADYFAQQADSAGDHRWLGSSGRPHLRGLGELPYHLTRAGRWDELAGVLTDFVFLEQKATHVGRVARGAGDSQTVVHAGVFQLQDDFALATVEMSGGGGRRGGPRLIVTAVDCGEGLVLRCPHCNTVHPFQAKWKGDEIECPNSDCRGPLKVNPFVAGK
ncbi:MAG: AAA family ATPase [Actinomycetota bacterium]